MNLTHQEYEKIKKEIKKITKGENPELVDDFVQDMLMIFLEHPKCEEMWLSGDWRWFIIRISLNNWRSSTSRFYYKNKKVKYTEINENYDIEDEEYDYERDQKIEGILQGLDLMYKSKDQKHRYEAIIILLYYSTGQSFTKLGQMMDADRSNISKIFKRGLINLRENYMIGDGEIPANISKIILDSKLLKEIKMKKKLTKRQEYEKWILDNRMIFFNHSMRNMENINKVFEIYNYFYNTNEQPSGCGLCVANKFNHFKELYF